MNLNLYGSLPKDRQEQMLKKICKGNEFLPQFEQRFRTMTAFSVRKSLNKDTDVFAYAPTPGQHVAVGYRVQYSGGLYTAEPWCFLIPDLMKPIGIEINAKPQNAAYFGSIVPDDLIAKHGTLAYSLMLGNLDLLKNNAYRLVSY